MSRQNRRQNCTGGAKTDSNQVDEPSNCIICLEKVSTRGKLSVCNHWFCFPCILEWSENTNTCPICKARFRCITKVHLSPFKSPPHKVRVGDRDQRVWNDDDDLAPEDVLAVVDEDDFDDDYEPPANVANPWTIGRHTRHQYQRGGATRTSRQASVDEYDMEDSFIDDSEETQLQAYFHDTTYNGEAVVDDDDDDDDDDDNSVLSEDSSSSSEVHLMSNSPYSLRSRSKLRTRTMNSGMINSTRLCQSSNQSCRSPASSGSFIVSDDDSCDDLNNDWGPLANQKKARNKVSQQLKAKNKAITKNPRPSDGSSTRERPRRQQGNRSRRSSQGNSKTRVRRDRLVEEGSQSSTNEQQPSKCTMSGWINGAERRTRVPASASAFNKRGRTQPHRTPKESTVASNEDDSKCEENCSSSSDDEFEESSSKIRGKRLNADDTNRSFPRKTTDSKQTRGGNNGPQLKQQQQNLSIASTSTVDAGNRSLVDDVDFANVTFILPTPQSERKRSILTRRKHRSPGSTFEDPEDNYGVKIKRDCNRAPPSHGGKIPENCRRRRETILSSERDVHTQASLVKKQKARRKRILSISSDSD